VRREITSSDRPVSGGLLPIWGSKTSRGACTYPKWKPVERENITSDKMLVRVRTSKGLALIHMRSIEKEK
jgi:hypothetical protein